MKTRNGFVSNSSSSSFVVVFPQKPTNYEETFKILFNNTPEHDLLEVYDYAKHYSEVAERVWGDICNYDESNLKQQLLNEFSSRYYYNTSLNTFYFGSNIYCDGNGGHWLEQPSRHFLSDKKTADALAKLELKEEELRNNHYEKQNSLGNNEKEKQKLHDKYIKESGKMWNKQAKFREILAKADVENFLNDYKDKFIFVVTYADDGGETVLEHGNIFRNVPHIKINHH